MEDSCFLVLARLIRMNLVSGLPGSDNIDQMISSSSLLSGFRVAVYEFHLIPETELVLPYGNQTNVLRGAFGWECRRLVCGAYFTEDCADCARTQSCPYAVIFEPKPPFGAEQLRNYQDIPRPYLFRVPPNAPSYYRSSNVFTFQLILVGSAVDYLPYFIVVFRELGRIGMGLNRGKFKVDRIDAILPLSEQKALIYSDQDNLVRNVQKVFTINEIASLVIGLPADNIRLNFIAPTKLIFQEREIGEPEFHHLFKRLRDRISSLLYFYCGQQTDASTAELYKKLGELSETIATKSRTIRHVDRFRLTRRREQHPLGGFTGELEFSGDLSPFLPFLVAGQWIGVGKNTVWGNGCYRITN